MENHSLKNDSIESITEDEKILWHAYPKQGFQLVFEDLIIIPFLLFFLFFIFYLSHLFNEFYLLSFIIILMYIIYDRYITGIINRKSTQYFITSKRVIIDSPKNANSIRFNEINKFSSTEHPFNYIYASIIFGEEETIFGKSSDESFKWENLLHSKAGLNLSRNEIEIAFIKNVKEPYDLIIKKIAEVKSKETPICP